MKPVTGRTVARARQDTSLAAPRGDNAVSRWTHADGSTAHEPDPHYNGNGLPAFWTCHVSLGKGERCDGELRLDGAKVPLTTPIVKGRATVEPPLSAQP